MAHYPEELTNIPCNSCSQSLQCWAFPIWLWFKIRLSKWHHNKAPWQVARGGADESRCTLWIERSKLKKYMSPSCANCIEIQDEVAPLQLFAGSYGWVVARNVLNACWRDKGWRLSLSHVFVASNEVLYKQLFLVPKEQHKRLDSALGKVLIDIVIGPKGDLQKLENQQVYPGSVWWASTSTWLAVCLVFFNNLWIDDAERWLILDTLEEVRSSVWQDSRSV